MNKLLTLLFLFFSFAIFAQAPANDDCNGVINLGTAPYCSNSIFFTNVNATPSDIGTFTNVPGCLTSGNSPRDVWFQFTADASITDYEITVTGADDGTGSTPLSTPQLVLYRGFCQVDELIIMDCIEANIGDSTATIKITGLTAGLTYFLRVGDYSAAAPNSGTFKLCIKEKSPEVNIDQGSSTACAGVLYDTGGPDGDYGPNEDHVFTICPTDFHQCISLQLEYYNIEGANLFSNPDKLIIYDGPDTLSPILAEVGDFEISDSNGGVCLQTYASSGCVTLRFISDNLVEFEGFKAIWQCTQAACPISEVITVDSLATNETIVDYLSTTYANTTIDTIICHNSSYGTFEATDNSNLGLKRGLLLTSGLATNAIGPNNVDDQSEDMFRPGDADLDALSNLLGDSLTSKDACVVILDVYAFTNKLSFEYVFGSEEYKEFANSDYNDIFAFFVSGSGITGVPELNNQQNIAVLPNSNTPVQINSVNHENNWQYYRNNNLGQSIQYDGLTADSLGTKKSLTAEINVIPCNHYKLKLAIADRVDEIYDSGVFISEISAGSPKLAMEFQNGLDYLVEDCATVDEILVIELKGEIQDTLTYNINILGTATNGDDYSLTIPPVLTFFSGQTKFTFPISVFNDNIIEPTENIIISLSANYGCGEVTFDNLIIELKDRIDIVAAIGVDSLDVCIQDGIQLSASGGATYVWSPADIMSNPAVGNPIAKPLLSGWAVVTGSAGSCIDTDSVYLNVHDVQVTALASDNEICLGQTIHLNSISTVLDPTYTWSPTTNIVDPSNKSTDATPTFSIDYIIEIEKFGCKASDTVKISVDTLFEPSLISDASICLGHSIQLADLVLSTSTYSWNPTSTLDNPNISATTATPIDPTTVYTLTTTSQNGYCFSTTPVAINTIPASLTILALPSMNPLDTIHLCAPDSTSLLAQTSTAGVGLSWSPNNGTLSSLTDSLVKVVPIVSGVYVATLQVGACILHDSTFVQIDSMPDLALEAIPFKDPYCPGDTISIFSENYDHDEYQEITHQWTPSTGMITDPSKFNLVVITVDTITYTRVSQIGACFDSIAITLNVDKPAEISVTQDKDTICAGDPVQLTATSSQGNDFVWMPIQGLSCDKCPNPTATPSQSITYSVGLESGNCPSEETVTITVNPAPSVQFPVDNNLCPNESVQLNETSDPANTYVWTVDDPDFDTITIAQPTVTPNATTTYTVNIDNGYCQLTESITINVANDSLYIDGADGVCPTYPITLTAVTNGQGDYVWMPGNITGQSIDVDPSTVTIYSVTYTYGDGCTLATSHQVDVYQEFLVTITAEKDTVFAGATIKVYATSDPAFNNPTYQWTQNGNTQPSTSEYLAVTASEGPFDEIIATLITPEGCEYQAIITIIVKPSTYEIPNAFTPNGDGKNDLFRPAILLGYELNNIQVFNRWGQLMYEGTDGWDGTYKGDKMPSDAYPYLIELKNPEGQSEPVKGNVTLLR